MHVDANMVLVRGEWNGWRTATVRVQDVEHVHWFQPEGAPRPLLHAFVCCTAILSGNVTHACDAATAPHHVRICFLKSHTPVCVFEELSKRAAPLDVVQVQPGAVATAAGVA